MFRHAVCFSVILLTSVSVAYAGITLNATRVIYLEGKKRRRWELKMIPLRRVLFRRGWTQAKAVR
jgi:P pilus assembly chaperone PapD